ncbi:MAG: ATP-binding protein [Myxococcota bacterium]
MGSVSGLAIESALKSWLNHRIEVELFRHAYAVRDLLEFTDATVPLTSFDRIADRLGTSTGARITIIDSSGKVLGDSDLDTQQLSQVENHRDRLEMRSAFTQGYGISRRYSTTLRTEMIYVAVVFQNTHGSGVVRASMPLLEVARVIGRLRLALLVSGILGLALAIFMSALASHLATRALRQLVKHARAVSSGVQNRRLTVASTDEVGHLAGSFNQVIDELEQTVRTLASERDYTETVLDSISEGILVLDDERRITRINGAGLELLSNHRPKLGDALLDSIRLPELAELAFAEPPPQEVTVEFEVSQSRLVRAHVAPLRTGGCVFVMRDITRTRLLENIRRDFVANVSHELRTPVAVIRANAETLVSADMDDVKQMKVFIDAIHRNAQRLTQIIADLLDLSRIEAGEYRLHLTEINVAQVVEQAAHRLQSAAEENNITIDIDVPADIRVHTDAHSLEQVVFNLLDNAIKYTTAGTRIQIRATVCDASCRIEIEDEGPGIEERHRNRIFERFYRVDAGRSREIGGTGLGLSIVKHLIETMGGDIGFTPRVPHGAIFWSTLPRNRVGRN